MYRQSAGCIRRNASDNERPCVFEVLVTYICTIVDYPVQRHLALYVRYLMDVKHVICLYIRFSAVDLNGYHLAGVAFESRFCSEVSDIICFVRVASRSKVSSTPLK